MTASIQPGQSDIDRGAAVLLCLLTWRGRFGNGEAVRSLREAKLDAAVVVTTLGRPCVHETVLRAFHTLAGQSAVWDGAGEVWRERRKGDPA